MSTPQLSVIIPTHNRPHLLPRAVQSALDQTFTDLEVVVVDDASREPVQLLEQPHLRVIRLDPGRGGAGARNAGTEVARGRWVTYLDDDDYWLPYMAEVSMAAIAQSSLTPPIAIISGIEVVKANGEISYKRVPPPLRMKGCSFSLEDLEPGYSYLTKQTLVVERSTIQQIGGWDESFRSRVHSELFLRLNPVCTIIGIPNITYRLCSHDEQRVSENLTLRQKSFHQLIDKHRTAFEAHPRMFADFVFNHASKCYQKRQWQSAIASLLWAFSINPTQVVRRTAPAKLTYFLQKIQSVG
jgi:glycosyltransferase involved in cell wall biosynthesis